MVEDTTSMRSHTRLRGNAPSRRIDWAARLIGAAGLLLTVVALMAVPLLSAAAETPVFDLRIPAADAETATKALSRQTGHATIFKSAEVESTQVNAVVGRFTLAQAVEALFTDTPLVGDLTQGEVITISRRSVGDVDDEGETSMGRRKTSKSWLGRIGAAIATVVLSGPAHAETVEPVGEQNVQVIEESIVTARRTSENLQEVPVAVTALTPEMLDRQNIVSASDLMFAVPSLTVAPTLTTLSNAYVIRGLPSGVQIYFAEAPCCNASTGSLPFLDMQSVQVLNGPQGTLFGRSSAAGTEYSNPRRTTA